MRIEFWMSDCGGEISKKQSLWGIEIPPPPPLQAIKILGGI